MTVNFGFIRKLIFTSINQIVKVNKEIKNAKNDIEKEINEIKELKKKANRYKINDLEKDNIEKENGEEVKCIKEESQKEDFCDVTLACDDGQKYALEMIPTYLFQCEYCHMDFLFETELKKQQRTHIENLARICDVCKKLFSDKNKLKERMKNDRNKFSFKTNNHKDMGSQGSSILPKLDQNFIFQVF